MNQSVNVRSLIHTSLQRGVTAAHINLSRLNGLSTETVKTVGAVL
jgi:hypothetical protein